MNLLVINAVLALGWAAFFGHFSAASLLGGFALGYATLWLVRPLYGETDYFRRFWKVVGLGLYFLKELVVSSVRVVAVVLAPGQRSRAGMIALPLDVSAPAEITVLANLISLTPGTLSVEVSEDRRVLYVHSMFLDDPDDLRRELKSGLERRVLEAFR